ncbi:hypothetical protein ACLOJK_005148 [Asimina triloba]
MCKNLLFFEVAELSRLREASIEGSLAFVPCQLEEQAHRGKPLKKKRQEDERLVREEEDNFQMKLVLCQEEARRFNVVVLSPETCQVGEVESAILAKGARASSAGTGLTRVPTVEVVEVQKEAAHRQGQRSLDAAATLTPIRRGVLTLGELSLSQSDEEIFQHLFDVEARALEILGDLLPMQSRGLWERYALDLTTPLDRKGCGSAERILRKFLPDVWRELRDLEERIYLINGCAFQAEYRYYMLKKSSSSTLGHHHAEDMIRVSRIMEAEECRRIIAAEKLPKEAVVFQTAKEVLRHDIPPSAWQYLEGSMMIV